MAGSDLSRRFSLRPQRAPPPWLHSRPRPSRGRRGPRSRPSADAVAHELADDEERQSRSCRRRKRIDGNADALGDELAGVAVEQAAAPCRRRRSSRRRSCRRRRARGDSTPQAPLTPWTATAPTGSSILSVVLDEQRASDHQHAGDDADQDRRRRGRRTRTAR